jgi:hypothetical protein
MVNFLLPKFTSKNTSVIKDEDDYLLKTDKVDLILEYSENTKPIEYTDKTNDLEYNDFKFLATIFNHNKFYIYSINLKHNNGIGNFIYAISSDFSLLDKEDSREKFIDNFVKYLGIEIDEKNLFKRLHCGNNHLKRRTIIKSLLEKKDYDNYNIFKYLCIRFSIGLVIMEDNTFQIIHEIPNRKCIILLKKDNNYWLLCNKDNTNYVYTMEETRGWLKLLKSNTFRLKDINTYKVVDLREIAKKNNIDLKDCNKKNDIYNKIKKWLD